eukprot:3143893-Rhodomonas_salina.1
MVICWPTSCPVLTQRIVIQYAPTPCPLSAYAMPGTDIAHGTIGLCISYALPGTDIAYHGTRRHTL